MKIKKGFTLIELLVVIAIIGILATTLAPKLREQLAKAKDAKAIAALGVMRTGYEIASMNKIVTDAKIQRVYFKEVIAHVDKKTKDLFTTAYFPTLKVGGLRSEPTGNVTYGGRMMISIDTDEVGSRTVLTDKKPQPIGEVMIFYSPSKKLYSTEGKRWDKY